MRQMLAIAWRYLWARPLAAALNLLLLTLGLGSISFLLLVSSQIDQAFERDLAGIDVVVGAKGSPMQLILAGVFHIDVPPGNIALADVQELQKDARIARLIPISLGDTFRGFRIVGTTPAYAQHYGVTLTQGTLWSAPMQAVAGSQVAASTGLTVGARFIGSHGLGANGHAHGENPYSVTGILAPCGCVLDRLLLTATESVWQVHEKATATDEEDRKLLEAEREITMALITYKSPLAAVTFPRFVNTTTEMQAAAPAVEITRLLRMLGVGTDVLRGFGAVLLLTAGLSVFIALWNAVRERRADLAMLRMLGAPPRRVAGLVVCEALLLASLAVVLGLLLGHGLTQVAGIWLQSERSLSLTGWTWLAAEGWIVLLGLGVGLVAALLPAWGAYRLDVTTLLQSRS
ncbi:MAG: FtsX-like permease family protein [Rhodoferax sp.]|nr:FtsX-like permease family protein [Rhodoferax sp.]